MNLAKCPTRVEPSAALSNKGLKEGFKWLIKSILNQMPDIFHRVARDVEADRLEEERRKAEFLKRMEERRKNEGQEAGSTSEGNGSLPGFVPIEECVAKTIDVNENERARRLQSSSAASSSRSSNHDSQPLDLEPEVDKSTKKRHSIIKTLSSKD